MRFNCGPTQKEKQEVKKHWHKHFAWLPIRVDRNERAWLETVERKGTLYEGAALWPSWKWEYRSMR